MKNTLNLILTIFFFCNISLFAVTAGKEIVIIKADKGPLGYEKIGEIHQPGYAQLTCTDPGTSTCSWTTKPLVTWAPSDSYDYFYEYALEQISNSVLTGTHSSNVYYNNEFVYRNVSWEHSISTDVTTITINFFIL